jgi:hypothetical protein
VIIHRELDIDFLSMSPAAPQPQLCHDMIFVNFSAAARFWPTMLPCLYRGMLIAPLFFCQSPLSSSWSEQCRPLARDRPLPFWWLFAQHHHLGKIDLREFLAMANSKISKF